MALHLPGLSFLIFIKKSRPHVRARVTEILRSCFVLIASLLIAAEFVPMQSHAQSKSIQTQRPKRKPLGVVKITESKPAGSSVTKFGTEDGLALSSVASGYRDRKGNLWFGTNGGGVSKYDGRSFQNYTTSHGLAHNMVVSIIEDSQGNLWFGTFGGGVSRFDGTSFTTLTTANGLAQNTVLSILETPNGDLWFGTFDGGVSRYDGKTFENFNSENGLPHNKVWSIMQGSDRNLYFGTDNGVAVYNGKLFSTLPAFEGKAVRSILRDSKNNVWFGTSSNGVGRLSGESLNWFTKRDGLSDNAIWQMSEDLRGNIWFATENEGATVFDGETFSSVRVAQGLSHNHVRSITIDNSGSVWFGTYGGGISRYDGQLVNTYEESQGLSSGKVRDVMEDHQGNLWIATLGGGVNKFDGKNFSHYTTASGLPSDQVRTMFEDRNNSIWFGTHGAGVSRFDGAEFVTYDVSSGLANNNVRSIFEDSEGRIWIGTDGGVTVFDEGTTRTFKTENGLAHNRVWDVLQDRNGNFWFGTFGGGVTQYDGKTFKTYTTADGLCHNSILCLFEDRNGTIWLGGVGGGLTRYDGETFLTIKKSDGLPDETVYDLVEAGDGGLWIGTNLGISNLTFVSADEKVFRPGEVTTKNSVLLSQFEFRFDSYNTATGFPIKDVNTNAMCITRIGLPKQSRTKGLVWIGCGDDKLIRFDPFAIPIKRDDPKIVLRNLKVNDEDVCWYCFQTPDVIDSAGLVQQEMILYKTNLDSAVRESLMSSFKGMTFDSVMKFGNVPVGLSLPHELNRVTFDFNAIETSRYFLVNYQYMLEGQDEKWSPASKDVQATYSNLWEGSYVFKVRAQGVDGKWGDPLTYAFVVKPPWWRTTAMYLLYFISSISLIIVVIKIRERRLEKEKSALEKIVSERTVELTHQMKTVELQRQEAEKQKQEADHQRKLVEEKNAEIFRQLENTEISLTNLTLQMIQRYHAYGELELELKKLSETGDPAKYKRAFSLVSTHRSLDNEWEQFNLYFNSLYKDFISKLRQRSSQLSNYDLRMCALIKMGHENREIATLLNIEITSVKMAKYRLKKKLMVDESVDLASFFETV